MQLGPLWGGGEIDNYEVINYRHILLFSQTLSSVVLREVGYKNTGKCPFSSISKCHRYGIGRSQNVFMNVIKTNNVNVSLV